MKKLGRLLRRSWLEGALDEYLEGVRDKGQEPHLIHATWLLEDVETIYRRLVGLEKGQPPGARLRRMFDDGMDTQRRYIGYFRKMGILDEPEGWDEDRGIRVVNPEYGIVGNIDCRIWVPEGIRVPVEIKAYADELFRKYRHRPRIAHYHQLQIYIFLDGVPYGYLLPEDKNNQDINPLKVFLDEAMISVALAKAAEVWDRVIKEVVL